MSHGCIENEDADKRGISFLVSLDRTSFILIDMYFLRHDLTMGRKLTLPKQDRRARVTNAVTGASGFFSKQRSRKLLKCFFIRNWFSGVATGVPRGPMSPGATI